MENVGSEDWQVLLSLFPKDWRERAKETAVDRLRGFASKRGSTADHSAAYRSRLFAA
jgi:hypothetical protein